MRAMFVVYLILIAGGIAFCATIGSCTLMRRFLKEQSLSIVFLLLFLGALGGQAVRDTPTSTNRRSSTATPRCRCRAMSCRRTSPWT
jgi:hypothetical protein